MPKYRSSTGPKYANRSIITLFTILRLAKEGLEARGARFYIAALLGTFALAQRLGDAASRRECAVSSRRLSTRNPARLSPQPSGHPVKCRTLSRAFAIPEQNCLFERVWLETDCDHYFFHFSFSHIILTVLLISTKRNAYKLFFFFNYFTFIYICFIEVYKYAFLFFFIRMEINMGRWKYIRN